MAVGRKSFSTLPRLITYRLHSTGHEWCTNCRVAYSVRRICVVPTVTEVEAIFNDMTSLLDSHHLSIDSPNIGVQWPSTMEQVQVKVTSCWMRVMLADCQTIVVSRDSGSSIR